MSDIIGSEQGSYAMAKPGGDITAIELNQEVNLFGGSLTNLTGTTMETFPPVKDATGPKVAQQQQQEEEEEGSWWGNLLGGIAVTAAIAGLAVLTVATCGVGLAAVALAGAAVGTGVVTAGVAYTDAKSGHARTASQFAGNLAGGAMVGATSAAAIYGMWTVLPAASQAAGIQAAMWTGTTSSFTMSTVPTLATYGGYGVMAVNGAFALNEINTIGTGQNVMADYVFNGDVQAYETGQMISGMALMGYTQIGAQNSTLGIREKPTNQESKSPNATQKQESSEETVSYYRVQGGGEGNKTSKTRIYVKEDGSISIPDKKSDLYVSIGDRQHAEYFRDQKRPGGQIVEFKVPKWFDNLVKENAIPQSGYNKNPLNQGGMAPQIVDPTTPGTSIGLPPPFVEWLEEVGSDGIIIK